MILTPSDQREFHLLVVEDEPINIQVVAECLRNSYKLSIAKTKAKALEILKQKPIDIVILDVMLPDGNGFDICKEVKTNKDTYGDVKIVFMTSLESPEDEAKGLRLGGSDYIHKPISAPVLQARVAIQTQLIRKTELLGHLAKFDALTEVPNRRAFDEQLENEWRRAYREKASLTLALIDIDYFKQYNDSYGHLAGDKALKQFAQCLSGHFKRATDFFSRYGGEEFGVIIYGMDLLEASRLVEEASESIRQLKIEHNQSDTSPFMSFSAGVCTTVPTSGNYQRFIEFADQLLYEAKEKGRNQLCGGHLPIYSSKAEKRVG